MTLLLRSCPNLSEIVVHRFEGSSAAIHTVLQAGRHQLQHLAFKNVNESTSVTHCEVLLTVLVDCPWLNCFVYDFCSYCRSTAALSLLCTHLDEPKLDCLAAASGAVSKLTLVGALPIFNLLCASAKRALGQIFSTVTDLTVPASVISTCDIPPKCPLLKRLTIRSDMDESTMRYVAAGCPLLEHLTVNCTHPYHHDRLHSSGLVEVLTKCPNLKTIRFDSDAPNVDHTILTTITDKRSKVQKISWKGAIGITPENLGRFRARAKELQLLPVTICVME